MPARAIWSALWRGAPVAAVPFFVAYMIGKILGLRLRQSWAVKRAESFSLIPREKIPGEILDRFRPYEGACEKAGFQLCGYFEPPYIGKKYGVVAVYLQDGGAIWATVAWVRLYWKTMSKDTIVFGCHSKLKSGIIFDTGPMAPQHFIKCMIPPSHEVIRLPLDASPQQTIEEHRARISGVSDIVCFEKYRLRDELARNAQDVLDHFIQQRIYVPLTPNEVQRILDS